MYLKMFGSLPARSSPVVDSWAEVVYRLLGSFDENRAKTLCL
jgi:hypothetical protein